MTSNIGAEKIKNILSGRGRPGFVRESFKDVSELIYRTTLEEMENFFRGIPEFLGRIGKENIVIFKELERWDLAGILEMRLKEVEQKLGRIEGLKLYFSKRLKDFILDESSDPFNKIMGARPLQRLVKKHILEPLSILVMKGPEEGGIGPGDQVFLTVENREVKIKRLFRKGIVPVVDRPKESESGNRLPVVVSPGDSASKITVESEENEGGTDVPVKIK